MLRLQAPLPDRYTTATPESLREMIRDAKTELGLRRLRDLLSAKERP